MKKTFRIALLLCLVLGTVFMLAACNKTPATPEETTPEETTPEQTTPEETTSPDVTDGPIPLETLNGMTAKQLYEAFIEEYFSSAQFDIELTVEQTDGDSVVLASSIATKISENAVYYSLTMDVLMDGKPMEVWLIDDVAYVNSYGEKIKRENIASMDEIIGEGALDAVWGSFKQDLPQVYIDALEAAQLYFADDVYYYTITVPVGNMEYDSVTETVYFNENGKVIGVTAIADGYSMRATINSYGKPVEVLPPTDADEYVPEFTPVDSLCGMNAAQLYETFENEYKNSTAYNIRYYWKQAPGKSYTPTEKNLIVNGNNRYYSYSGIYSEPIKAWLFDDVAYIEYGNWIDDGNWKMKCSPEDIDDIFNEEFYNSLFPTLIQDAPVAYYDALATAQLYFDAIHKAYCCTVTFFETEDSTVPTTKTVYFNANGKLIQITETVGESYLQIDVNYETPTEILPPEDAEKYCEIPKFPTTDAEFYQFYVNVCTDLQKADNLAVEISIPGASYTYNIAGANKRIVVYKDGNDARRWIVDGIGYTKTNNNKASKTPLTTGFLKEFSDVENLFPITPLQQEKLQNFEFYYNFYIYESTLTFEQIDESGALLQYEYKISDVHNRVEVCIAKLVEGEKIETREFYFQIYPDLQIEAPFTY